MSGRCGVDVGGWWRCSVEGEDLVVVVVVVVMSRWVKAWWGRGGGALSGVGAAGVRDITTPTAAE